VAITTYLRGIHYVKDYMIKYLKMVFYASEKEQLVFTDGHKKIEFSRRPDVLKRASWDFRNVPAVILQNVSSTYIQRSIAKDLIDVAAYDQTGNPYEDISVMDDKRVVGGDIELVTTWQIWATSIEERDHLADMVCLYLAHPDAKDFLLKQGVVVAGSPRVSGDREIKEPQIDHPIYGTDLSVTLMGPWRSISDADVTLAELFVDISVELEF